VQLHGDAQAVEKLVGLSLGIPAVHLGEFAFQLGGALAVGIGEIGFGVQGLFLFHDIVQLAVAHDDRVHHAVFIVLVVVLLQHAHTVVRPHGHRAGGGFQRTGQNAQKR
jgi:hypothetical protein